MSNVEINCFILLFYNKYLSFNLSFSNLISICCPGNALNCLVANGPNRKSLLNSVGREVAT